MRKQILDGEAGIIIFFADDDPDSTPILLYDNAMEGQRPCQPLVLFYAPVIVGLEHGKIGVFIEWVCLQIEARTVNVGDNDPDSLAQRG